MRRLNALEIIALTVLIAGGLNRGLVGLIRVDALTAALGAYSAAARVLEVLVGLAAVYWAVIAGGLVMRVDDGGRWSGIKRNNHTDIHAPDIFNGRRRRGGGRL